MLSCNFLMGVELIRLPQIPVRFCPSKETLSVLNDREWISSFSGGKDSTSLVTWIEWLRRIGFIKRSKEPRLVMSDTTVEYPFLRGIADRVIETLTNSGWQCEIVTPRVDQKLYCMIFGRGVTPVHPGNRRLMRWCTRSTKIDPMNIFSDTVGDDIIKLSGVRWGESDNRDGKLKASGCAAGGECGLPEPGDGVYGPIITWTTCKVIEWLEGKVGDDVNEQIADLLPMMQELVGVYEVVKEQDGLWGIPPKVTSLRFGCVGCPAITNEKITRSRQGRTNPQWQHLRRIHTEIWPALYMRKNRCCRIRKKDGIRFGKVYKAGYVGYGPVRMEARKKYFAVLLDIQEKSGVTLVTPEDIAFVHRCWQEKRYPKGWSEADELVQPPDDGLYAGMSA